MKSVKKALLFGFSLWAIPFLVAFLIFPVRNLDRPLFESIMPIVIVLCVVFFSILYFKDVKKHFIGEGIILGMSWFVISFAIDLLLFMPDSQMQMSFIDYIKDIGLIYLIIPTITIGVGYILSTR